MSQHVCMTLDPEYGAAGMSGENNVCLVFDFHKLLGDYECLDLTDNGEAEVRFSGITNFDKYLIAIYTTNKVWAKGDGWEGFFYRPISEWFPEKLKPLVRALPSVKAITRAISDANESLKFETDEDGDHHQAMGPHGAKISCEIVYQPYEFEFEGVCSYDKFSRFLEDKPTVVIRGVHAGKMRSGIGTHMMDEAIRHFRAMGYDQFALNASPMGLSIDLIKFYERFGFRIVQHQGGNAMMALSDKTEDMDTYVEPSDPVYHTYEKDPESYRY